MTIRTQDDAETGSKQDTVFLSHSATGIWTELDDDISQYLTDVTAGVGTMTEASPASDRFDVSHPRVIGVKAKVTNTDTGTFFTRGAGGTLLALDISVAGTVRAVSDNIAEGSIAIPGVAAGAKTYIFAWVSRANPETTGAGDAVQSWLYAYNVTDGTFDRVEFSHAVPTLGGSTATWGTYTTTISDFFHGNRAQSATEIAIDWGASSPSAPTTAVDKVLTSLPLDVASGIGDENQLYGPVPQWALRQNLHARWRTLSPLVNRRFASTPTIGLTTATDHEAYRFAPGLVSYNMNLGWLTPALVPPGVTHAFVRVHVQSWVTASTAVPVGIQILSMSRLPDDLDGGPLVFFPVGETFTRDDTAAGFGEWQVDAVVKLAIGAGGWTYFCPAYEFDPADASMNDANANIAIRALVACPCVDSTVGGA